METTTMPVAGSVLDLATILRATLETTVRRLGYDPAARMLEVRRVPLEGRWGYSSAVCKSLGRGPEAAQALAVAVVAALPAHPLVAQAEAVKGFVNFYVDVAAYANGLLAEVAARGAAWGHGLPQPGRVMVEFAQPNTHKAVHVGHLRNIILGEAVVRIMRAAGREVIAATYPGDIGMHVIKCLWCYRTFYAGQEPATDRGRWLGHIYAESDARLEYRKQVLGLLAEALQAPTLTVALTAWLRAHGETSAAAAADVQRLLAVAATTKPDPDPDTAHEPDEELGADIDLSSMSDATVPALWAELGVQLPADDPLRADYARLDLHRDWWPLAPGWRADVRALYALWEAKDPDLRDLWQRTRQWSLDEFATVYRTLDVHFDVEFYESEVEEEGRGIVEELVRRGIATDLRAEGKPVLVHLDDQLRAHPALREKYFDKLYKKAKDGTLTERETYKVLVVLRSDGTTLYATKDLALARRKFEDYRVDQSIYVIDVRQSLYFQQVFKVLELYGFTQADQCRQLGYEIVGTKEGAFSSRKGNVPLYEDFMREALAHARTEIDRVAAETLERRPDAAPRHGTAADKDAVALQIALGAIKYTMLDKDTNTVIVFDWEQVLNPRQQSAPYIMYAYARAGSVLAKAAAEAGDPHPAAPTPNPSPKGGGERDEPHPPTLSPEGQEGDHGHSSLGEKSSFSPPPLGEVLEERSSALSPPFVGAGRGEKSSFSPPFVGEGLRVGSSFSPPFVGEGLEVGSSSSLPPSGQGVGVGAAESALDFSRLQLSAADLALVESMKTREDRDPQKRHLAGLLAELALLDGISRYPDEVERAAANSNPVVLTRYLFGLAEAFSKFWDTSRILTAETPALRQSRLALTAAARQTLGNGLHLLGITAPDAM